MFVTLDRVGGLFVATDEQFKDEVREHLERYRIAGYDLELRDPNFLALDVRLRVCVSPGHFRSHVKAALTKAFGRHDGPGEQRGFFHPDNFTFGTPLYLSHIYQRAMAVDGVASVEVARLVRTGAASQTLYDEILREEGVLRPQALEIIRVDSDGSLPELGKVELDMLGGI